MGIITWERIAEDIAIDILAEWGLENDHIEHTSISDKTLFVEQLKKHFKEELDG